MNNWQQCKSYLKKKNPTYFLLIKLNTLFAIKRCPESGPWPPHLVNHPFYGWRSRLAPSFRFLLADYGSSGPVEDQYGRDAHS